MKKLLLILFTFSVMLTNAQDSITVKIPDTTKLTVNKVYEDVKAGIQGVAKALKAPVEHVYGVLIKQQVVNSIVWITLFLIAFILVVHFTAKYKDDKEKWWERVEYSDDYPTWVGVLRVIQGVIGVIMFIVCIFHIDTIVQGFVNPEYGAIKDIMNFVK